MWLVAVPAVLRVGPITVEAEGGAAAGFGLQGLQGLPGGGVVPDVNFFGTELLITLTMAETAGVERVGRPALSVIMDARIMIWFVVTLETRQSLVIGSRATSVAEAGAARSAETTTRLPFPRVPFLMARPVNCCAPWRHGESTTVRAVRAVVVVVVLSFWFVVSLRPYAGSAPGGGRRVSCEIWRREGTRDATTEVVTSPEIVVPDAGDSGDISRAVPVAGADARTRSQTRSAHERAILSIIISLRF